MAVKLNAVVLSSCLVVVLGMGCSDENANTSDIHEESTLPDYSSRPLWVRRMESKENQVVIYHLNEPYAFEVAEVDWFLEDGEFDLEIKTKGNADFGDPCDPKLAMESVIVDANNIYELEREVVEVEVGWDTEEESKENNIFRTYLNAHLPVDNNKVELQRRSPTEVEVHWKGVSQNMWWYKNPPSIIEVFCVLTHDKRD